MSTKPNIAVETGAPPASFAGRLRAPQAERWGSFFTKEKAMKKPIAAVLSITVALAGCATASKDIAGNYVSPMQYQSYDCDQLASETQRIQVRVNQLGGRLDEASSNASHYTQLIAHEPLSRI
jgi:starvation-inducible outer membrane lipoprotein